MMPREILKNIGQIELRTNRIVTETLAVHAHTGQNRFADQTLWTPQRNPPTFTP